MLNKELTAQIAAYFIWREGGRSARLKVMKLLYLAERDYLLKYCGRLTGDSMFSMKNGPVLSQSLDLMQSGDEPDSPWSKWIKGEPNYCLGLRKKINGIEDFDLFSKASLSVLESVYSKYGHYDKWQLRDKTHTKECCPEWQDPGDSCIPISIDSLLRCHGKSKEETEQIISFLRETDSYQQLISGLV